MSDPEKIGLTATVPVEVILAAGLVPVDLNNRFITHPDRDRLLSMAEARGSLLVSHTPRRPARRGWRMRFTVWPKL